MIAAATENVHAAVAAAAPAGIEVRVADPQHLDEVGFLVAAWHDVLEPLPASSVEVVQVLSAGTEWIEPLVPRTATLCNARGMRDVPVAEWVVGAILGARTGLLAGARRTTWQPEAVAELAGTTVLILGYGSIGRAVEVRLAPFGCTVVAVGRRQLDELPALLPAADVVVVLAPLTEDTRGMVDAAFLARMRDGALLVNAGRGPVVVTDALVAELEAGRLDAVLDVTDPEPLPDGHALWSLALGITAHHAGDSTASDARAAAFAGAQIGRYARGEPLLNVVLAAGR